MSKEQILKKLDFIPAQKLNEVSNMIDSMLQEEVEHPEFKLKTDPENIDRSKDILARSFLSENLARIIEDDIIPPFTIGIYGKWGSGKSVFLNFLKQDLEKKSDSASLVLYFNAWKYESSGNVMYSLYRKVEELLPKFKIDELRNSRLKRSFLRSMANLFSEKTKIDVRKLFQFSTKSKITEILDENYDSINAVEREFESHVETVLSYKNKKRLVIIIDDLDRCNPENVVSMLELMKNFLGTKNCIFIISADKNVVMSGIKHKYSNSPFISGDDYLEKIVNYSLELKLDPKVGIKNLIEYYFQTYPSLLNKSKPDFLLIAFETLQNQSLRTAKRILDKYLLMIKIPATLSNIDYRILLFTIILQEMVPDFYSDIKKYPNSNFIDSVQKSSLSNNSNIENMSEQERAKHKYILRTQLKELINQFKRYYFGGQNAEQQDISTLLRKSIHYTETLTLTA